MKKVILSLIPFIILFDTGCSSTSSTLVSCTDCNLKNGKIYANSGGSPFSGRIGLFDGDKTLLASVNVSRGRVKGLDVYEEDGSRSVEMRFVKSFEMEQLQGVFNSSNQPPDLDMSTYSEKGVEIMNFSIRSNSLKGDIKNDEGKRLFRVNMDPNNGSGRFEAWYSDGKKRLNVVNDGKDNFSGYYWDSEGKRSSENLKNHAQDFLENDLREVFRKLERKLEDSMKSFERFNFN